MITKMTIEIEVPEETEVSELQDLYGEIAEYIDRFSTNLSVAKDLQIRLPKGVYLPL
jgi:hypothetical protein